METGRTRTTRLVTGPLALSLLLLTACQPSAQQEDETVAVDTAAVLASLDSLRAAYLQAVAEEDWQRTGTMVTEDALVVPPGTAARDSMRAASDGPIPPGATLDLDPREVRVLSVDWAYEIGIGTVTWTPEGAGEERTLRDTYLVLFHRTDDGWKVHREVASSRLLPEGWGEP